MRGLWITSLHSLQRRQPVRRCGYILRLLDVHSDAAVGIVDADEDIRPVSEGK